MPDNQNSSIYKNLPCRIVVRLRMTKVSLIHMVANGVVSRYWRNKLTQLLTHWSTATSADHRGRIATPRHFVFLYCKTVTVTL